MSLITKLIFIAALVFSIILPFGYYLAGERSRKRYKRSLAMNVFSFFSIILVASILLYAGPAMAESGAEASAAASNAAGMGYLAAALATGLPCIGGGFAVASAASAALGAISEDSSILGKSLIFVGMAEGVCLYGVIISFMILGQLG